MDLLPDLSSWKNRSCHNPVLEVVDICYMLLGQPSSPGLSLIDDGVWENYWRFCVTGDRISCLESLLAILGLSKETFCASLRWYFTSLK